MNKILKAVRELSYALQEERIKPPDYVMLHSQDELLHISNMFEKEFGALYPSDRFMDMIKQGDSDYISIQINGIEFRAPASQSLMQSVLRLRFNTSYTTL